MELNLSSSQTALARVTKRMMAANAPPPMPKLRRRKRPHRCRGYMLDAIRGSKGIWSVVAKKLGCTISAVQRSLSQPGWELVLDAFQQEKLRASGMVEKRLFDIALHSVDDNASIRAAMIILPVMNPEYRPSSKVVVEGGDKPIQHQHVHVVVTSDVLGLPPEQRLQVLEAAEQQEGDMNGEGEVKDVCDSV